jgi:hypothetical protein
MPRSGEVGRSITLGVKFYDDGVLFDPYEIVSVQILSARVGGTVLATVVPVKVSDGVYEISWTIPANTTIGLLYDSWTWRALAGMNTNIRVYSFRVLAYSEQAVVVTRPTALKVVQGPMFVGEMERNFFNNVTEELIEKIVAQKVIYYSVSEKHTKTHPLYDESAKKTVFTPVEIPALVLYNEPVQSANRFTIDTIYSIEVYMQYKELLDRNVTPREGDFCKYGKILYEIEQLTQPQIVFGQINNKVMLKAKCRVARQSQLEILDDLKGYNES